MKIHAAITVTPVTLMMNTVSPVTSLQVNVFKTSNLSGRLGRLFWVRRRVPVEVPRSRWWV